MIHDQKVRNPYKAFSPYDLSHTIDRCINCESRKHVVATITLANKSGPICLNCFKSNKK